MYTGIHKLPLLVLHLINGCELSARTDHLQVYVARNARFDWEAGCEIPAGEVQRGADNQVRNLGDGLCGDEGEPVVCLGLFLASLEDVAVL